MSKHKRIIAHASATVLAFAGLFGCCHAPDIKQAESRAVIASAADAKTNGIRIGNYEIGSRGGYIYSIDRRKTPYNELVDKIAKDIEACHFPNDLQKIMAFNYILEEKLDQEYFYPLIDGEGYKNGKKVKSADIYTEDVSALGMNAAIGAGVCRNIAKFEQAVMTKLGLQVSYQQCESLERSGGHAICGYKNITAGDGIILPQIFSENVGRYLNLYYFKGDTFYQADTGEPAYKEYKNTMRNAETIEEDDIENLERVIDQNRAEVYRIERIVDQSTDESEYEEYQDKLIDIMGKGAMSGIITYSKGKKTYHFENKRKKAEVMGEVKTEADTYTEIAIYDKSGNLAYEVVGNEDKIYSAYTPKGYDGDAWQLEEKKPSIYNEFQKIYEQHYANLAAME